MDPLIIGQPAPDFELSDLAGKPVHLSDFSGRLVLINFWSAECANSERADKAVSGFLDRLTLLTVACNANEPLEMLRQAARSRGLPVVLVDSGQKVVDLYGAQTTPHFFLVDQAGFLRYQGALDDATFRKRVPTSFYLRDALEALLSDQPVPVTETAPYGCAIMRAYPET